VSTGYGPNGEVAGVPNRYIRDGILNSERYLSCTQLERLLFIEMILIADDFGLLKVSYVPLRRRVTACEGTTEEAVVRMLSHLNDAGLIHIYEHDNNRYAYIPNNGFQVRAFKPKCPIPDTGFNEIKALAEKRLSVAKHMRADASQMLSGCSTTSTSTSTYKAGSTDPVDNSGPVDNSPGGHPQTPAPPGKEKTKQRGGWWKTDQGIERAGTQLGMQPNLGETYSQFKERIFEKIGRP
jgi:hypothetical protein